MCIQMYNIHLVFHAVVLQPTCASPQGVYLAEEGQPVQVCFTLPNTFRVVDFVIQNTSTLGKFICHAVLNNCIVFDPLFVR